MAGRYSTLTSAVFLILSYLAQINCSKLNVPRVLLPLFHDISINFTLEATEGGCYKWTTSRQDIIRLILEEIDWENDCSSKVIVSSISRETTRSTAIVFAEEINSGHILRCDVIVDVIYSLSIVTTTRELYMDEAPEAFEVNAYDDQGNEFTTLEGVPFEWSIAGLGNVQVLRFISFKDSPYETPPAVRMFDDQDKQGHIILLEGVKTGSAKVCVKLPHPEYKHVKVSEVQLMVVANIIIDPADAYILRGDEIQFKIFQIQNGKLEEINIMGSQYYFEVEVPNIASIQENSGYVIGLFEGKTRVLLHDKNIDESEANGIKMMSASLTVAEPAYMTLNLLPYKNWAVLIEDRHEIVVDIFTSKDHRITLSKLVEIRTDVGELFPISLRSSNGSWLVGKGIEEGIAPVESALVAVASPRFGRLGADIPIKAKNAITIYPRIVLQPSEAIFPWDPVTKPKYELQIQALGGDGKFVWSSSNHSVGTVTQNGLARTTYRGYFEAAAAMARNPHNRQIAKIYVLPAVRLEIVEFAMEAEVGEIIYLHVALYAELELTKGAGKKFVPFTKCQNLNFKVKTSDPNFVYNKTNYIDLVGISCANLAIIGSQIGTARVTVQYISSGLVLEDSVTVATYNKLIVDYPTIVNKQVVLALGTSIHLKFVGGPRPWPGRLGHHEVKLAASHKLMVRAKDVTTSLNLPPETYVVKVLCKKLGESMVTLTIRNAPGSPSCKSQPSVANVLVVCGKPRTLIITPDLKTTNYSSCPMSKNDNAVVQSYKNIDLEVVVNDDMGRTFMNISSLKFDWSVSPTEFGNFKVADGVIIEDDTDGLFPISVKNTQIIVPKSQSGSILVKGVVVGYKDQVLAENSIAPEVPAFVDNDDKLFETPVIVATINLFLVGDAKVSPNVITIYNHPTNKKIVHISQGSGYYEMDLTAEDICDVKYKEGVREIEITPINDGQVEVSLMDLCLSSQPAIIQVNVVSVRAIKIDMPDKVEIGKCIRAIVRLFDENDNLMPVPDMIMLEMKSQMEDEIANVKLMAEDPNDKWGFGEVHYVVTGTVLGDTKLEFTAGSGARFVTSGPYDLQVFPPLKLLPRNVTMLIGSTLQITSTGGPQPDSNIEYAAAANNIVELSNTGGIQGVALGHTKVVGRAIGSSSISGHPIIYSQDQIDVHVVQLKGIHIFTPLTRFQTGTKVPVWAIGLPGKLSPVILGSVVPEFNYTWTVSDNSVVKIENIFQSRGVDYENPDQVSMRLVAVRPGATTLKLSVAVPGRAANSNDKLVVFNARLEIEVFDGFMITNPKGVKGQPILIAPHSKLQISTNKDALHQVSYKVYGGSDVVSVSRTGLLESFGALGEAMVLATSTDDHGVKQVLALVILVKPIHYMMMDIRAEWRIATGHVSHTLPVGVEFHLKATYHDNTGATFMGIPGSELRTLMNRNDLVRLSPIADNTTFYVATRKNGNTVVRFWVEGNHKTVDYIKFDSIAATDLQQSHVTTGDMFCLYSPVVVTQASTEVNGIWETSDEEQIEIESQTGLARILTSKGSAVDISYTLTPAASLRVEVLPVSNIDLIPTEDPDKVLTNAVGYDGYVVHVLLKSIADKNKKSNMLTAGNCKDIVPVLDVYPFNCLLEFNTNEDISAETVFSSSPSYDPAKGLYCCRILPKLVNDANVSLLNTKVNLVARSENGVLSKHMELVFVPSVAVQPKELQISEVFLATFTVTGRSDILTDLNVKVSDSNMLEVIKISQPTTTTAVYQVRLIDYHWKLDELEDPMHVIVSVVKSGQVTKIPVRTNLAGNERIGVAMGICSARGPTEPPLSNLLYAYRHVLAIVLSMIIIFLVTLYVYSNYVTPTVNVNVQPRTHRSFSLLNPGTGTFSQPTMTASSLPTSSFSPNTSNAYPSCSCNASARQQACMHHRTNLSTSVFDSSTEPVYGDPNSFYQNAELRRNRRFL